MFLPLPQNDGRHEFFTCVTLIDITKTNSVRHYHKGMDESEAEYNIKRNQRRNWESILQVIGLRSQPTHLTDSVMYLDEELTQYNFGTIFSTGTLWVFNFGVEHEGIFDLPNKPLGGLLNDLHNVPIVTGLLETVNINPAIIDIYSDETKNTIILK